jgi:hypothetical protein
MPDTDTPLKDAIAKMDAFPENEVTIGGVYEQGGDAGGMIEGQKDIGKPGGWSMAAAAQWMKKAGWRATGVLKWKGKP